LGERLVLPYVPEYLEGFIECYKETNKCSVYIGEKGVLKVNVKVGSMHVSTLYVGFPQQQGQRANANKYDYDLKKYS
jgi:hypothetical protein